MKFSVLVIGVCIALFNTTAYAGEIQPGTVLCSLNAPTVVGFHLIDVRARDRAYVGSYDSGDIRISGSYQPQASSLKVSVEKLNEDDEVEYEILNVESQLVEQQFLRAKTKHENDNIDLYCYFIPKREIL